MNTRDLFMVYFVKPIGLLGPIKIGISADPERRCREYSAWSALPLELMGSVPGYWADEQFLHSCLGNHHSHGEWFHAAPTVLDAVQAVLSSGNFDVVRATLSPALNLISKKSIEARSKNRMSA